MRQPGTRLIQGVSAVLVGLAVGCGGEPAPVMVQGECQTLYGGDVCTWAEVQGETVLSVGATIPMTTVANAPEEMEMAWPPVAGALVRLPEQARQATGLDLLSVYWEAHGHPPGPYLTPHFDFHFYRIGSDERQAIDCADSTKPATLPAGYELPDEDIPGLGVLIGICVPAMGMHSLLGTELRSTSIFEKAMVVGYYHGQPIFIEPMIPRATLAAQQSFTLPVPAIEGWASGTLPTGFEAVWDSTAQAYKFTFATTAAAATH